MFGNIGCKRSLTAGLFAASTIACRFVPCAYAQTIPLDTTSGLRPHGVSVETTTYKGRKALRVNVFARVGCCMEEQSIGYRRWHRSHTGDPLSQWHHQSG